MTEPTSGGEPGVRALATFDFSGPEGGRNAERRIILGVVLLLLGLAIMIGCGAAWVATFFHEELWEWADLIGGAAWFVGFFGLALTVIGFTLLQRGRRRRLQALEAGMNVLEAVAGDPQPETDKRILPDDGAEPTEQPKPLV